MVRLHSEMAKVNAECKHLTFRRIAASIVEREKEKGEIFIQKFSKLLGSAAEFLGFYVEFEHLGVGGELLSSRWYSL